MKNKLLFLGILTLIPFSLFGCSQETTESLSSEIEQTSEETTEIKETSSTEEVSSTEEISSSEELTIEEPETTEILISESKDKYKDNEAYQVGLKFVEILQNKDFKSLKDVCNLYNNSVISDEDLEYAMRTSEYGDIIGVEDEFNLISFDQRNENKKILIFKINNIQYEINLVPDANKNWKVSISDIVVTNFQFLVPAGVTVYWDGVELDRDKLSTPYTDNKMLDLYTVTCMPQKTLLKFTSIEYGDWEKEITPKYMSAPYEIDRTFPEDQLEKVLNTIKALWKNMSKDYIKGIDKEEFLEKYFGTNVPKSVKEDAYNRFSAFMKTDTYLATEIVDIEPWEGQFEGISMDKVATVNFKYKIKLTIYVPPVKHSEKNKDGTYNVWYEEQEPRYVVSDWIYSNMRLVKNGYFYRVYEVTDPEFFDGYTEK